ncbi:unnamed protein product [Adineta ricciae]|uniref:Phospholipase n=1 Tax=Adineta ricciae TaxID=249248 RepID=A0A814E4L0_ADIRI|nr:unnamed protein product [Adineta ricciae]
MLKVLKQRQTGLIPFVYEYFLSTPPKYDLDEKKNWPLLLFLHGAGERFPPIEKILAHGPPKLVNAYLTQKFDDVDAECAQLLTENFITCSPQVSQGYGWNSQVLTDLIHQLVDTYRIDRDKIYCTGISMGGYGAWDLAMEQPKIFAAIMPICGGGDESKVSCLKHLPIWNFHGQLDDVVLVDESTRLIESLNSDLCRSIIYPDLKHDSWTRTYNNKDIYLWLLQQTRAKDVAV